MPRAQATVCAVAVWRVPRARRAVRECIFAILRVTERLLRYSNVLLAGRQDTTTGDIPVIGYFYSLSG
jgi:hypothetical protein